MQNNFQDLFVCGQEGKEFFFFGVYPVYRCLFVFFSRQHHLIRNYFPFFCTPCGRYDVYTPTRNIVFHNYQPNPQGIEPTEWQKRQHNRLKVQSLERIKTMAHIKDDQSDTVRANMGIYGIGKRRTINQLNEFVGIDLATGQGNQQVS